MIIATCGHQVDDMDELMNCSLAEYSREGNRAIAYVSYCKMCYEKACKDGYVLYDVGEEDEWLDYGN